MGLPLSDLSHSGHRGEVEITYLGTYLPIHVLFRYLFTTRKLSLTRPTFGPCFIFSIAFFWANRKIATFFPAREDYHPFLGKSFITFWATETTPGFLPNPHPTPRRANFAFFRSSQRLLSQ